MKKLRVFSILPLAVLALAGAAAPAAEAKPLRVISTTTILADLVRQVGGNRVESLCLLKPGVDAHVYQPTADDVRLLAGADLVVVNGLGLEGWLDQLVAQAAPRRPVVVASAGVTPLQRGGGADPHAWQDAKNGIAYAKAIRDALSAADGTGAEDYAAWCEAYCAQLRAVDAWILKQLATVPPERRVLVTSHEALAYFGAAYGLEIHAVEGVATGQEADAAHVAALIALMRQRAIRTVFAENVVNPKVVERLGAEAGAVLGDALFSDSLDAPGRPAGSYIGMLLCNTRAIVNGLR
jgi:zinc/manganese transport system substrate-binding protein